MRVARTYIIRGRVQGVGFRYFAAAAAAREGIHGSVVNRPDGHVEVVAEGERESIARFEATLRHGPPAARVDEVTAIESSPVGREIGFVIR